jgi:hypothetical protein
MHLLALLCLCMISKENKVTVIPHTLSTHSSDVALDGICLFPKLKMVLKEGC